MAFFSGGPHVGTRHYSEDTQRQNAGWQGPLCQGRAESLSLTQGWHLNLKQGRGEPEEVPADFGDSIAVRPRGCDRPPQ